MSVTDGKHARHEELMILYSYLCYIHIHSSCFYRSDIYSFFFHCELLQIIQTTLCWTSVGKQIFRHLLHILPVDGQHQIC